MPTPLRRRRALRAGRLPSSRSTSQRLDDPPSWWTRRAPCSVCWHRLPS